MRYREEKDKKVNLDLELEVNEKMDLASDFDEKVLKKISRNKSKGGIRGVRKNTLIIIITLLILLNILGALFLIKNYEVKKTSSSELLFDEISD